MDIGMLYRGRQRESRDSSGRIAGCVLPQSVRGFFKTDTCQTEKLTLCIYVVKAKEKRVARIVTMRFC